MRDWKDASIKVGGRAKATALATVCGVLGLLPGETGLSFRVRRRDIRRRYSNRSRVLFKEALERYRGLPHLDLGANVGEYTTRLSASGSKVYAFEPDPWTAEKLRTNVRHLGNVEVIEAAAFVADDIVPMYRKNDFYDNPEINSQGTSIFAEKRNVENTQAFEARCVDFVRFLDSLDGNIGIIKMDVEGAEVALLDALLGWDGLSRIGAIFVETHETKIPSQRVDVDRLWRQTRGITKPSISLDWK
jgi:FkbM family methyltransferase